MFLSEPLKGTGQHAAEPPLFNYALTNIYS